MQHLGEIDQKRQNSRPKNAKLIYKWSHVLCLLMQAPVYSHACSCRHIAKPFLLQLLLACHSHWNIEVDIQPR